ncbi:6-bladed beta-propeller [Parabacteroides goldsteinii]|uniref:6-bladed beta-propeller n=2 Tax=Parabacteroides goldsteinii TaxID=328812 RepID=UPI0025709D25|nr:6-bladed beta-propeller [Parabacteroides goldsteinii]
MNKIILGMTLVSISFWSCHKSSQNLQEKIENSTPVASMISHQKSVEVNIDLNKDCLPFDSLMTKVSYVKLETTGDNLVGGISQILFVDDKIIIVDAEKSKTITVYDGKGHFLYKIGTLVQGLMEYGSLDHVAFTPGKEMLVITDLKSGCLKYYSIGGIYVKSVKLPYWFSESEFLTDNLIAGFWSGGTVIPGENKNYKPLLVITDLFGNVSSSAFQSYYKKEYTSTILEPIRHFNDRVLYNNPNTDSIFLLTPNGIELAYHLNIKGAKPMIINEDITNDLLRDHRRNNPFFNGDFIELKDGAIFHIFESGFPGYRFGIYSNAKQRTFCCDGFRYSPFFCFFDAPKARYGDNTVVVDARSDIALACKDELYKLGKKEEIDEFYKGLTEDSNPILFFYELKF